MNSANIKRSIVRNGQKTSVSLEDEFWQGLREIANAQKAKLSTLVRQIDQGRARQQSVLGDPRLRIQPAARASVVGEFGAVTQQAVESADLH